MAKLSNLKSRLSTFRGRLDTPAPKNERERSAQRTKDMPWRRWYGTQQWKRLREEVKLRDRYTCQMCKRIGVQKHELHVDHIKPHLGQKELFYDASNCMTLCVHCHVSRKQSMEAKEIRGVWY